jgi:hypothetical protein
MTYEAWRISFQSSEQAARSAYQTACELAKQRDELLSALERLSFAALCRDSAMGDQCRLIEVRAELDAANAQAIAALGKVKGGTA